MSRKALMPPVPPAQPRVSIVLTNYNGLENLEACLPAVEKAARFQNLVDEIIVVDDCSTDGSVEFLAREHPDIRVVRLDRRSSFLGAANAGFAAARNRLVALLSNDMSPDEGFLVPLIEHFDDPEIFCVGAQLFEAEGRFESGRRVGVFLLGTLFLLDSAKAYKPLGLFVNPADDRAAPSIFTGGNVLVDRNKFRELGGYDPLFLPFYWEDTDLCYRAWKRGWRVLTEPRSRISHHHALGTIRKNFDKSFILCTRKRNRLLFLWKNISDPVFLVQHALVLAFLLCFSWMTGNLYFYRSFYQALKRLPEVRARRREERGRARRTDRDVLRLVNGGQPHEELVPQSLT